jgi:hypothetical protein
MYDELIAFIGLIVLELKNYIKQEASIVDDDVARENISSVKIIIKRLYTIQENLLDPKYYELADCHFIKDWEEEYKLSSEQYLEMERQHPVGYCFVSKAICKRLKKTVIIDHLCSFLDTLGHYVNYYYEL